jgi:glycine dehydrogenase subunit 1
MGELNLDRAHYLREKIGGLKNFRVETSVPIFNEFMVSSNRPFAEIESRLISQGILPGVDLAPFYPELKGSFLVCATETKTKEDLDRFVEALDKNR